MDKVIKQRPDIYIYKNKYGAGKDHSLAGDFG